MYRSVQEGAPVGGSKGRSKIAHIFFNKHGPKIKINLNPCKIENETFV